MAEQLRKKHVMVISARTGFVLMVCCPIVTFYSLLPLSKWQSSLCKSCLFKWNETIWFSTQLLYICLSTSQTSYS